MANRFSTGTGFLLSLFLIFALCTTSIWAADYPDIEYAYPDQSVWTTKRDAQGQLDNPLLRLASAMFEKAGLSWYSNPYPAKRMFRRVKSGETPFTMLVRAPSLKECCLFSKESVTSTELRVYRRASLPKVNGKADLKGRSIIVIQGYSYGGIGRFLRDEKSGAELLVTPSHESAFAMMGRGRADYVLDYTGPSEEVLAENPIDGITYDVLTRLDVYLVLSKSYPDAPQIMQRLESAVATLDKEKILRGEQ